LINSTHPSGGWELENCTVSGLKITAGQWPDKMTIQTIFDRTFLNFEGRLTGQVLILAGHCPLTGRYFGPCGVKVICPAMFFAA